MARKLLVGRLGAGSITIALCAALPGCNLAIQSTTDCVGSPSTRGTSSVVCADAAADHAADATTDTAGDAVVDGTQDQSQDQGSGDGL